MHIRLHARKGLAAAVVTALALSLGSLAAPAFADTTPDRVANDAVWNDTAGNPVRAQGGNVLQVDGVYYWLGVQLEKESSAAISVNLYSSPDLTNWTFVKAVYTQHETSGELALGKWIGRPKLLHNPTTDTFIVALAVDGQGHGAREGFFTSKSIDGDYTYQGSTLVNGSTIGDASVFVEGGNAYLVYVGNNGTGGADTTRNLNIGVAPLGSDWLSVGPPLANPTVNSNQNEAPSIVKVGSTYYMLASGMNWWAGTKTSYRTSTDLLTWSEWSTVATQPSSATSFETQFEQVIPVTGSTGTSYIYNGDRYAQYYGTGVAAPSGVGYTAWYPLTFDNGVPTIHGATDIDIDAGAGTVTWNPVVNGRFDQVKGAASAPYWTFTGSGGKVDPATADSTGAFYSMYGQSAYTAGVSQTLTLPNGTYQLTAMTRSGGGQNTAKLYVRGNGAADENAQTVDLTTAHGWTERSIEFTVSTGTAKIGIDSASTSGGRWLNLDNVAVWPAGTQSIEFPTIADRAYGDTSIPLTGTASSGLPVSYTASGTACTIANDTVTIDSAGSCSITATQAGDDRFHAAEPVTRTFTVAPADSEVTATDVATPWGTPADVTVKVGSAAPGEVAGEVTLGEGETSLGVADLENGQARFTLPPGLAGGDHHLSATYLGGGNYDKSTDDLTVTVVLPDQWTSTKAYQAGDRVSYNGSVFSAQWYSKAQKPGSNVYDAWEALAMTADGTAVWTSSRVFTAGDVVSYHGKTFRAGWYTRNEEPGSATGPWEEIAAAADGTDLWTPSRTFNAGDRAVYNGVTYVAKWYTRNQAPCAANGPWLAV